MLVLTWFGTIIRADSATKMLIHAPLWPSPEESGDIMIDAPDRVLTEPADVAGMPGVTVVPGQVPGHVHFLRDGRMLRTDPKRAALSFFDAEAAEGPDTFMLLQPAEAHSLRIILSHAWTLEPHGARLRPAALRVATGFFLQFGDLRLDLNAVRPAPSETEPGTMVLVPASADAPAITLRRAPDAEDLTPVVLRHGRKSRAVPLAASPEAFRVTRDRRLALIGNPEFLAPPLTSCDTDSDWVFMRYEGDQELTLGRQILTTQIHRENGKLVLLTTPAEGLVMDMQGAAQPSFRAEDVGDDLPPWMQRNGDAVYIDRTAVDAAPSLHGSHIVVGHTALQDKGRGRIETLLALDILGRHAPASAKLLVPAAQAQAAADMPDLLRVLGFAELPAVVVDRPIVRVEEAIWLEGGSLETMPAKLLREFRARLPKARRGKRRILVRQTGAGSYQNEAVMVEFAKKRDLDIVDLADMSIEAQIALFGDIDLVVAPHGPALANLLFVQPGTKVLEISPDIAFRPYYWRLAAKLGLAYAVLPCPTVDRVFDGALRVNTERLRALYMMLNARL
jgi:capsular polysaccharide biosynthesis protein